MGIQLVCFVEQIQFFRKFLSPKASGYWSRLVAQVWLLFTLRRPSLRLAEMPTWLNYVELRWDYFKTLRTSSSAQSSRESSAHSAPSASSLTSSNGYSLAFVILLQRASS